MYKFLQSITRIVTAVFLVAFLCVYLSMFILVGVSNKNNLEYDITFVYKILPVLVIKDTDVFISKENQQLYDVAAFAVGPIIVMTKDCWADTDILNHELCHVKQSYRGLFVVHILRNYFSPKYKVLSEYEAYSVEKYAPTKDEFVEILSSDLYTTGLNKSQIKSIVLSL